METMLSLVLNLWIPVRDYRTSFSCRFYDYRYAWCYIVHRSPEGHYKYLVNPDEQEGPYLTIPYEILEPVTDAMQKYKYHFDEDTSLIAYLGHSDKLVKEHLGETIPDSWDIAIHYEYGDLDKIVVTQGERKFTSETWDEISFETIDNHFSEANSDENDSSSESDTEP